MEEMKTYEDERNAFISQVEELKKKIVSIESGLGIDMKELKEIPAYVPPKRRETYKAEPVQEKRIESVPLKEIPAVNIKIPVGNEIVEQRENLPVQQYRETKNEAARVSAVVLNKQIDDLKEKARQVEEISNMVEALRSNRQENVQKPSAAATKAVSLEQTVIQPHKDTTLQEHGAQPKSAVKINVADQSRKAPIEKERNSNENVDAGLKSSDLSHLPTLVKNLNELIRTNTDISIQLRRVIDETRRTNNTSKMSELIRKLAYLTSNG